MLSCPNPICVNHTIPAKNWYVKNGYFKPKNTQQKTPRYRCKACGKSFSTHTDKPTAYQKKPEINTLLFKLLVSGVSLRRAAQILEVKYDTVVLHFQYLAEQAQKQHQLFLQTVQTSFVQVDELETFIHARPKALSVPMVVRVKTGEILGFNVAKMPANGFLADIGKSLYQWTVDERSAKFQSMLQDIAGSLKPNVTFKCDSKSSYPKWIHSIVPNAVIEQIVAGKKKSKSEPKAFDELFSINNTFARMRHDMNRLARKTWSTTKSIQGLEAHIWLYVAWNKRVS
jgi:transposase-like protein